MKYAVSLFITGGALSWFVVTSGGLWWLLAWPAASFLLVGVAYAGLGPGVFAKRPNLGTLHPLAKVVLGPFLASTWIIWRLLITSGENVYDRVVGPFYLGRRAADDEVPDDVDLVVDMTTEFDALPPGAENRAYWCLPTLDGSVPSSSAFMDLAQRVADWKGRGVYVHCAAGHGRSATLLAAVLLLRGEAATLREAIRLIKSQRPLAGPNRRQRAFLERLFPTPPRQ